MPPPPPETLPDITRPDAQLVLAGTWTVGTPATQQRAADAALGAWEREQLPDAALSHTCLLADDGLTLFHYSQWGDDVALERFLSGGAAERFELMLPTHPGSVAQDLTKYRLYRSMTGGDSVVPGCIVVVSVRFDHADDVRLRSWVDLVFEAMRGDPPIAGGVAGHFHVSVDGTRVLNFAEWTDAESHQRALDRNPGPAWRTVREFAGIVSADVKRFRPYRSISRPRRAARAS